MPYLMITDNIVIDYYYFYPFILFKLALFRILKAFT